MRPSKWLVFIRSPLAGFDRSLTVNPKLAVGDNLGGKRLFDVILWRVLREHSFDEEPGHDMANNCRRLWPLIFGREIDPRAEIIAPALAIRKAGYGEPTRDYKQELRDALMAGA
jgi:hypothetical protein